MASSSGHSLRLIRLFCVWKGLLFAAVCLSPDSYDTSTDLLFDAATDRGTPGMSLLIGFIARKIVRWDAIYYVSIAEQGYVHEQQWAFGWGFTRLIKAVAALSPLVLPRLLSQTLGALFISNVSHLLSVLVLYRLVMLIQAYERARPTLPFIAACLHITAPAGVFLSAPFGESLFSLLHFSGLLSYCMSRQTVHGAAWRGLRQDVYLIASGVFFACAATVRSNALLSGTIFLYDLVISLPQLPRLMRSMSGLRYLTSLVLAGTLLAVGFVLPQYIAYSEYCNSTGETRPWCDKFPPSVYTFVQDHYWNVGFLRYWTLANLPLFALAAPMLTILLYSGFQTNSESWKRIASSKRGPHQVQAVRTGHTFMEECLQRIAIPQVMLAILALTTFHVQVITRLASGYPIPYIWFASLIHQRSDKVIYDHDITVAQVGTRWMVIYALVQGGLYASFLPPA